MRKFRDRSDAGRQLGEALRSKGWKRPVVLGIPRGGVPVAAELASILGGDLGVVVAHKLRARYQPELAIGAVTASGDRWINEALAWETGADNDYLERETAFQVAEARRREEAFNGRRRPSLEGRVVIVVDDGIATGATAIAAVRAAKSAGASRVILAVPVGPPDTLERLRAEADEVFCLREEADFWAIGQFYDAFGSVADEEVRRILDSYSSPARAPA